MRDWGLVGVQGWEEKTNKDGSRGLGKGGGREGQEGKSTGGRQVVAESWRFKTLHFSTYNTVFVKCNVFPCAHIPCSSIKNAQFIYYSSSTS